MFQSSCSVFGIQNEETPKYETIFSSEDKEIRLYDSYIVAKTSVKGNYDEAQSKAFKSLAAYIFGENSSKDKMAMTSPVVQGNVEKSETIAMTSPVVQEKKNDAWEMQFIMPAKYTLQTLPEPKTKNITFEKIPKRYIAAIKYTWNTSEKRNLKKAQVLRDWLETLGSYKVVSEAKYAGYNPPWTLPFLRRQEMLVEVDPTDN